MLVADGWDFSKAKHRRALLELQMEEEPDEIFVSPKCTLWSATQSINVKTEEDGIELQERRWLDHEVHLKFWADTHTLSTQASPKHGRHQHSKTYQGCVSPLTNVPMEQSHGLMKATGHQSRRQPPSRPPNKPWCGTCPVAAARTTAINHLKADTVVEQLRTTQRPWQDTLQRQP